jgi:exodeoxyribonuclease VII large subunit
MVKQLEAIASDHEKLAYDAIALVRGGGASSGMECFNQYALAEALVQMPVPVITGIGHHADHNVCDEIAHTVRMTPTDVANFLIEHQEGFDSTLVQYWDQVCDIARITLSDETAFIGRAAQALVSGVRLSATRSGRALDHAAFRLRHTTQQHVLLQGSLVEDLHQRLARESRLLVQLNEGAMQEYTHKLNVGAETLINKETEGLAHQEEYIRLLDPREVLRRGYSYTLHNGKTLTAATDVAPGDTITTVLQEGTVDSIIQ